MISVSLPKETVEKLEATRQRSRQSRSAFIASLIEKETEEARWQKIYRRGEQTAREFKIASEDDVDRLLHGAEA